MQIAIFSDVHSNLEALNAVLDQLEQEKPDRVLFLGDAVGYGPDPNACMERIFEVADQMVVGNHDHAAVGLTDIGSFNPFARDATLWTRSVLTPANRDRILKMALTGSEEDLFLVHGSPERPGSWAYIHSLPEAAHYFDFFDEKACLIGHTHRPAVYMSDGNNVEQSQETMLTFKEQFRYIVNVGSVGQPRDRNPDAGYVLFDTVEKRLTFKRVKYNFRITQEKMRAVRLPSFLVERLAYGE